MKNLITVSALLLASTMAFAAPQVEITSFDYADNTNINNRVAEICGKVSNPTTPTTVVHITVDPKHTPAHYNVIAGKNGLFCATVVTFDGRALAEVE